MGTVDFSVGAGVARISLNRPGAANAIDAAMSGDLCTIADRCRADTSVRAVLIAGAGARFSAGGDISLFASTAPGELSPLLDSIIVDYHRALATLASLPVPIVCAVQGAVAGGALGLLYVSDLVLASTDCRFALGYAAIGLSSDGGSTWFLPRLIGSVRAAQLFLRNRVVTAEEALDWGLVSEVIDADALPERASAVARELATGPTQAFGAIRALLRQSWDTALEDQLEHERLAMTRLGASADAREGIVAFSQKRSPNFTG